MGDTESDATWSMVFGQMKDRGLEGVRYVVSDKHRGIAAAIERHLQGAVWQRCEVHFKRNVCAHVRRADRQWVMDFLKEVTDASTLPEAREKRVEAAEDIEEKYPDVAEMLG